MFSYIKQTFGRMFARKWQPITFHHIFEHFQTLLLQDHQRAMELIADLGEKSGRRSRFRPEISPGFRARAPTPLAPYGKGLEPHRVQPLSNSILRWIESCLRSRSWREG